LFNNRVKGGNWAGQVRQLGLVNSPAKWPGWLSADRVLGSLGFGPKEVKGYEAYIEGRVLELGSKAGRKELEEEWEALRRGWYVGGEGFLEKLQEQVEQVMKGRRRESHSGEAKAAHDAAAAERELKRALRALGLNEEGVERIPKGAPEKVVLAWWLRRRTTVSLRWVSKRLGMGHYSRVTQAINRAGRRPGRKLNQVKRKLARLETMSQV